MLSENTKSLQAIFFIDFGCVFVQKFYTLIDTLYDNMNTFYFHDTHSFLHELDSASVMIVGSSSVNLHKALLLAKNAREAGWRGFLALMGENLNLSNLSEVARCGYNDYFCVGPFMDLQREAKYVIARSRSVMKTYSTVQSIVELALFRTKGLTYSECRALAAYSDDYPRYHQLSIKIGKSEVQTRKMFSTIFNKLEVDNLAQIAHLITIYKYNTYNV